MRIQHNIMAMNAYRNYTNNTSALSKNLEKLSSGYKINRAGDDAAGLAISEKMRAQITGLEAAQKNVKDGISLVKTAEGAMQEVQDMLNRMVYLATQSANGTYDNEVDRANLQKEVDQLRTEINRIADSANFNGINLLDGSLATEGVGAADAVKLSGNIAGTKSAATAGVYESSAAIGALANNMAANDTFSYTVSLNDGTSTTVNFTMQLDDAGKATKLVADDGTEYTVTENNPSVDELSEAVLAELKKTGLSKDFKIEQGDAAGKFKFTALEAGTKAPQVNAMDYKTVNSGKPADPTAVGVTAKGPLGDGIEVDPTKLTEYDGTNYDDAVFSINGKKFVVMAKNMDAATDTWMKATEGLGNDVTILIGGTDGLKVADANWNQNIAKIKEATGLDVTDAVAEKDFGAAADTGVAAGNGFRLSAGKGTLSGGLVLQIGDTSDSYNQLRVGIDDMHAKALGIADVDITTQEGAADAVNVIKKAINSVSMTRGTLGATQNRLEHTQNNLSVMEENITDAESTIRDTDVAEEMMSYTKNNILIQSAQAMLAQANQVPQGVLQLLQ